MMPDAGADGSEPAGPGWRRRPEESLPSPLGSADILGLGRRRLGVLCTLLLVLLILATRLAVLPASIWERDEAYLGLAVLHFDPADDRPHAPWFPLWILVGKLAAPAFSEPARGLQMLSALLGTWILFPLAAMLAIWLRRDLAAAAAVLYLLIPGAWFLAGRGLSDTPATALLVAAGAWWLRPGDADRDTASGSVAAALCLLVRPQLLLVVAALAVRRWILVSGRGRVLLTVPLGAAAAAAGAGLAVAAGSPEVLARSLASQLRYQAGGLAMVEPSFTGSGLARALAQPEAAAAWLALVALGMFVWHRHRRVAGSPWHLVLAGIVPALTTALWLSDPAQPRYWLPLLALSAGFVVVGLAATLGRAAAVGAVAGAVTLSLAIGLPQARLIRSDPSPVMAALARADEEASRRSGVVVVDRTLRVFADYAVETGEIRSTLLSDFSVEIGAVAPPPARRTVAVFDRGRGSFVIRADSREVFQSELPWVRRLGPDRFLEVTVAAGAHVVSTPTPW